MFQEVNAIFDLGDADRDGQIDLNEFITVMTTSSPVAYTVSFWIRHNPINLNFSASS